MNESTTKTEITLHKGRYNEANVTIIDGIPQTKLTFFYCGYAYDVTKAELYPRNGMFLFTGEREVYGAGELNKRNFASTSDWHIREAFRKPRDIETKTVWEDHDFLIN